MKRLSSKAIAQTLLLVFALGAAAQGMESRRFGLGLMIGSPTGIGFKYWLSGDNALSGGIGLGSDAVIQLNYLWHAFGEIRPDEGRLPIHYGFGAQIQSARDRSRVDLRGVLGLTYIFAKSPFDIYFELAPLLEVGSDPALRITASVGARYYF